MNKLVALFLLAPSLAWAQCSAPSNSYITLNGTTATTTISPLCGETDSNGYLYPVPCKQEKSELEKAIEQIDKSISAAQTDIDALCKAKAVLQKQVK